jgi:formylglycine-generating enzyme required for sulfatase activity
MNEDRNPEPPSSEKIISWAGRWRRRVLVAAIFTFVVGDITYLAWALIPGHDNPPLAVVPFDIDTAAERQLGWAKHLNVPVEFVNSLGMKFAIIPPGEFQMGAKPSEKAFKEREGPVHPVTLTNAFYLGQHEVTLGQFREFVKATGYYIQTDVPVGSAPSGNLKDGNWSGDPLRPWEATGFDQQATHPVANVSWFDAMAFCRWLSDQEGRTYRLPYEAEWEFACRAGTESVFNCGNGLWFFGPMGNVADQSLRPGLIGHKEDATPWTDGYAFTSPVGTYRPNAFGIGDMHGNVREWCMDWCEDDYFEHSPRVNPQGRERGDQRTVRGGAWASNEYYCRTGRRMKRPPGTRNIRDGFRILCEIEPTVNFGPFSPTFSWADQQANWNWGSMEGEND